MRISWNWQLCASRVWSRHLPAGRSTAMSADEFAAFLRRDHEQQGALIKMVGLGE
jgi:hypothetical protein